MIHACLKNLMCSDFDLREYRPENPSSFGFFVEMEIGIANEEGTDLFQLHVCTPQWLEDQVREGGPQWIESQLVLSSYNFDELHEFLSRKINSIQGNNWMEIVSKLRLLAHWEFNGYRE